MTPFFKSILKLFLGGILMIIVLFALFAGALLNPRIFYEKRTQVEQLTIYHNENLDSNLIKVLEAVLTLTRKAELYDPNYELIFCLNEGKWYPYLATQIKGRAFAIAFDNITVFLSKLVPEENYAIFNDHKRNLTHVLAHEFLHCYQVNAFGFNQLAMPFWKVEGYVEYASMGQDTLHQDLKKSLSKLNEWEKNGLSGWDWIAFRDQRGTTMNYFKAWLMIQYLIEVEDMAYREIVKDERPEAEIEQAMWEWYASQD